MHPEEAEEAPGAARNHPIYPTRFALWGNDFFIAPGWVLTCIRDVHAPESGRQFLRRPVRPSWPIAFRRIRDLAVSCVPRPPAPSTTKPPPCGTCWRTTVPISIDPMLVPPQLAGIVGITLVAIVALLRADRADTVAVAVAVIKALPELAATLLRLRRRPRQ